MGMQQEPTALRDFDPAYVGSGSIASQMIGTAQRPMSALPRKQTSRSPIDIVRSGRLRRHALFPFARGTTCAAMRSIAT
jgi:hypothetical protein